MISLLSVGIEELLVTFTSIVPSPIGSIVVLDPNSAKKNCVGDGIPFIKTGNYSPNSTLVSSPQPENP